MKLTEEKLKKIIKEELDDLKEFTDPQGRDDAIVQQLSKAMKAGKSEDEIDRILRQIRSPRKRKILLDKAKQQSKGFLSRLFGLEEEDNKGEGLK